MNKKNYCSYQLEEFFEKKKKLIIYMLYAYLHYLIKLLYIFINGFCYSIGKI